MQIKELRDYVMMSQSEFAKFIGIPVGTIRNWEQGIANPPKYVITMIINTIRRDKMINIETIKFNKMLEHLVELERNGIDEFENASSKTFNTKIFYDKNSKVDNKCRVVLDACIIEDKDCIHHDIVSYFDSETNEFQVYVKLNDDGDMNSPYLEVLLNDSKERIVIENNEWYFV